MIDTMAAMMPYMRPLSLVSFALIALGFVLGAVSRMSGGRNRIARWCGTFVLFAGFFFLACEVAGRFLGFEPTLLFAEPLDREMFRNQWPFWTIGALFLVTSVIVRRLARPAAAR